MKRSFHVWLLFTVFLSVFVISTGSYLIARALPDKNKTQRLELQQKPTCIANRRTLCPNAQTKPYRVKGMHYRPQKHIEYQGTGIASYYGIRDKFHGKKTATGEIFNAHGLTAAHKTLPIPCYVRVTNLENNKSLILKVNDRGPFYKNRIIDVSEKAAKELGFHYDGTARVRIETLPEESIELQNNGTEIERS